jgi:hypothetical protein
MLEPERTLRLLAICGLVILTASCTGGPTGGAKPSVSQAPVTAAAPSSPSPPAPLKLDAGVSHFNEHWRSQRRLQWDWGRVPWGGRWKSFLFNTNDGVGIGFQLGHRLATMGCCLTPLASGARAMAYVEISHRRGVLIAHIAPDVERVKYDCVQCEDVVGIIGRQLNGRYYGIPQTAVMFISANGEGDNDGYLIAFDRHGHRLAQDWIALRPCGTEGCPAGLAWGSLLPGTRFLGD